MCLRQVVASLEQKAVLAAEQAQQAAQTAAAIAEKAIKHAQVRHTPTQVNEVMNVELHVIYPTNRQTYSE